MKKKSVGQMNKILIYIIISVVLIIGLLYMFSKISSKRNFSAEQQEILKICNNKAKSLGYDINDMSVTYDFNNTSWHKYRNQGDPNFEDIDFQAVHYGPKNRTTLGGTLTIVVDKKKKEVIWFQKGQ